jgi:hypothetical protein
MKGFTMTTTQQSKQFIFDYILDGIDGAGYDVELNSDKDKINFVIDCLNAEYGWKVTRDGQFSALVDWLMGLPSAVSMAYSYHDIIKLAKEQGSLSQYATEKEEDTICDNYWRYMAMRILELHKKLN